MHRDNIWFDQTSSNLNLAGFESKPARFSLKRIISRATLTTESSSQFSSSWNIRSVFGLTVLNVFRPFYLNRWFSNFGYFSKYSQLEKICSKWKLNETNCVDKKKIFWLSQGFCSSSSGHMWSNIPFNMIAASGLRTISVMWRISHMRNVKTIWKVDK